MVEKSKLCKKIYSFSSPKCQKTPLVILNAKLLQDNNVYTAN